MPLVAVRAEPFTFVTMNLALVPRSVVKPVKVTVPAFWRTKLVAVTTALLVATAPCSTAMRLPPWTLMVANVWEIDAAAVVEPVMRRLPLLRLSTVVSARRRLLLVTARLFPPSTRPRFCPAATPKPVLRTLMIGFVICPAAPV